MEDCPKNTGALVGIIVMIFICTSFTAFFSTPGLFFSKEIKKVDPSDDTNIKNLKTADVIAHVMIVTLVSTIIAAVGLMGVPLVKKMDSN